MVFTRSSYFIFFLLFLACISKAQDDDLTFEFGAKGYLYNAGPSKTTFALNIEKFVSDEFCLNYHASFGTLNTGFNQNSFTMHMPAGPVIGCFLAGVVLKGGGDGELLLYSFLIPEGVSYYPVKNKKYQFGLTADVLGLNFNAEKNSLFTSNWSYQQNYGMVFKINATRKSYVAIRAGYQIDYFTKNTLHGFNGSLLLGFRN